MTALKHSNCNNKIICIFREKEIHVPKYYKKLGEKKTGMCKNKTGLNYILSFECFHCFFGWTLNVYPEVGERGIHGEV